MQNEIKAGSELYMAFYDGRSGRNGPVVVKSVGSKWITINEYRSERFDRQTLRSESGRSVLYLSKDIYDAKVEHASAWQALRRLVDRSIAPEHLTTDEIKQAIDLLRVKQ